MLPGGDHGGVRIGPVLAAVLLGACGGPSLTIVPPSDLPADVYGTPAPRPPGEIPSVGTVYMVEEGRVLPTNVSLPEAHSLPEALLLALLSEAPVSAHSAIPSDTRLIALNLQGGVATVDLSDEFERSAPGRALVLRVAQVVYTLTEAPNVVGVLFSIEGTPAAVIAGDDRVVGRPVTRADYERFSPRD